jgi:hypothetical protein
MHILATNDGPHPAEKWAHITTTEILSLIEIEHGAKPSAKIDKMELEVKLLRVLSAGHQRMMNFEREAISHDGDVRLAAALHEPEIVNDVVSEIVKAAGSTMFSEHFRSNSVTAFLHEVVANHFASSIHIERLWHTDRNPGKEHCQLYRERFGVAKRASSIQG